MVPSGRVEAGEDHLLDSSIRIPLITAGFRIQRVHTVATAGRALLVWAEGDIYGGWRPHIEVPLAIDVPAALIERLESRGDDEAAQLVGLGTAAVPALVAVQPNGAIPASRSPTPSGPTAPFSTSVAPTGC
jgi:hypothetical protein